MGANALASGNIELFMKKLLLTLLIVLACVSYAFGTTITVAANQISQLPFNPSGIGASRSITVTTTNGLTTVTSAGLFPSNIVGIGGFQVLFSGADSTQYVVASVQSTSSLTLATTFAGTTGSKTMTLYPYVLLRTYATAGFQDNVTGQNVQPGAPGSGNFFKQVAVSIINTGSGNVAWMPEFTIPSTTDALINNQARYVFGFYRTDNSFLAFYLCGSVQQLAIPAITPTTWTAICNYNAPGGVVPPNTEVYTKSQIDQRFPSCTANQMLYFDVTGNVLRCLTIGTNLSITSATLNATGGGGGTPTATLITDSNYTALVSDWLVSMTAASSTKTVTLYNPVGNSGKIISIFKRDATANTIAITDGMSTYSIYAPGAGIQLVSNGLNWVVQSY